MIREVNMVWPKYGIYVLVIFLATIVTVSVVGVFTNTVPFLHDKDNIVRLARASRQLAEIRVSGLQPRDHMDGLLSPELLDNNVYFDVGVKPLNVSPGVNYHVALLSRDGYLYDSVPVSWTVNDTAAAEMSVLLKAPAVDSDVDSLVRDFNRFYSERTRQALEQGEWLLDW